MEDVLDDFGADYNTSAIARGRYLPTIVDDEIDSDTDSNHDKNHTSSVIKNNDSSTAKSDHVASVSIVTTNNQTSSFIEYSPQRSRIVDSNVQALSTTVVPPVNTTNSRDSRNAATTSFSFSPSHTHVCHPAPNPIPDHPSMNESFGTDTHGFASSDTGPGRVTSSGNDPRMMTSQGTDPHRVTSSLNTSVCVDELSDVDDSISCVGQKQLLAATTASATDTASIRHSDSHFKAIEPPSFTANTDCSVETQLYTSSSLKRSNSVGSDNTDLILGDAENMMTHLTHQQQQQHSKQQHQQQQQQTTKDAKFNSALHPVKEYSMSMYNLSMSDRPAHKSHDNADTSFHSHDQHTKGKFNKITIGYPMTSVSYGLL